MTQHIHITQETKGVYVIAVTPFTDQGEIDWPSVDSMVEFYINAGVDGITILGIMGEAQKLTESESAEFVSYCLSRVRKRVQVIVGVSRPGVQNIAALARLAMEAGASGVMLAPITGLKTQEQVLGYVNTVIDQLGPHIPVVYQDYPQVTNVYVSPETLVLLVDAHPSIVMVKHEDAPGLRKLSRVRTLCNGKKHRYLSILSGNGGLYLPQELRRGADGAMTGFAYPEMVVAVCKAARAGRFEDAEDLFDAYLPLVRHEQQPEIGLALRKEVLRRRGAIRSAALRAPGFKLDAADLAELDGLMKRLELKLSSETKQKHLTHS